MSDNMQPRKKHKTIRTLENKASNGNIKALFQLAKYYEDGQYVEKNFEKSEAYFLKALDKFKLQSLQISSLKLINFRTFDDVVLDVRKQPNSNLILLIGNNGAGKTTILESISLCLSWLIKRITTKGGNGEFIGPLDIKNDNTAEYSSILTNLSVLKDYDVELELSKSKEGSNSSRKNKLESITQLADLYKFANSRDDQFNFPLMAYYSVERSIDINKKDIESFEEFSALKPWNKFDGYAKSLNGTADFKLFFSWFKYLEDINNEKFNPNNKSSTSIDRLKEELKRDILHSIGEQSKIGNKATESLIDSLIQGSKKMGDLEVEIDNDHYLESNKYIRYVSEAIYTFMPDFSNLHVQRTPKLDMLVEKNKVSLSVLQLSQGEKTLLALVADIARRLVILNPSLENPLKGDGIVLIDEIDLHLHPRWQQSVLPSLLETFPNIQFIVTTHSPQVLTTVQNSSVRILSENKVFNTTVGTLGEESRSVLEDVMHVDSRPVGSMSEKLKIYLENINRGEIFSNDTLSMRIDLEKHYGKNHSQLRLADTAINRWLAVHKT